MNCRRGLGQGAAVAAVGLAVVVAAAPAAAAHGSLSVTVVKAGPKDGGGEPSLAIARDGTLYISYPGNAMDMVVSHDGGATWTRATSPEAPSGDTSVNVDASGAVYESNLRGVETDADTLQVDLFKSFDEGRTWPQKSQSFLPSGNSTAQPLLVDRQWVDAVIPPGRTTNQANVYLEYHDWGPSQVWVQTSTDGGAHFGRPVDVITSPQAQAATFCNSIPGGVKVVPYGRNQYGKPYRHPGRVYAAWLAADPANPATGCNLTQLAAFHAVWIAYSDDQGQTWNDRLVFDGGPLHDASEIFADLTLDDEGDPYMAFAMNIEPEFDIWATASFDGGDTWLRPARVNASAGTHYYPAIAAGRPGEVVVAYLATSDVVPTTPYGKPQPAADQNSDWRVYLAQSLDLTGRQAPTFSNAVVTPTAMHHGDICTLGIFCLAVPNSNRDLLDFIDVQVDPEGRAHVAFTGDYGAYDGIYAANQASGPTVGAPGH